MPKKKNDGYDILNTSKYYILDNEGNVIESNLKEWSRWFSEKRSNRFIKQETIEVKNLTDITSIWISTVFLGMGHGRSSTGEELLFETCLFLNDDSLVVARYATMKESLEGHEMIKNFLLSLVDDKNFIENIERMKKKIMDKVDKDKKCINSGKNH